MRKHPWVLPLLGFMAFPISLAQQQQYGRDAEIQRGAHDSDTLAWWHRTQALSNDSMAGREPGTPEYDRAAVSAHLVGYGRGEPVLGDSIYNGTLDDAAYVALLEQLAMRQSGHAFTRSVNHGSAYLKLKATCTLVSTPHLVWGWVIHVPFEATK